MSQARGSVIKYTTTTCFTSLILLSFLIQNLLLVSGYQLSILYHATMHSVLPTVSARIAWPMQNLIAVTLILGNVNQIENMDPPTENLYLDNWSVIWDSEL